MNGLPQGTWAPAPGIAPRRVLGQRSSLSLAIRVLFEAPRPHLSLLLCANALRAVERRERRPKCARCFALRSLGVSSFQISRNGQQLRGYNKRLKLFGGPMLWSFCFDRRRQRLPPSYPPQQCGVVFERAWRLVFDPRLPNLRGCHEESFVARNRRRRGAIVALSTVSLAHADVGLWVNGGLSNIGLVDVATAAVTDVN